MNEKDAELIRSQLDQKENPNNMPLPLGKPPLAGQTGPEKTDLKIIPHICHFLDAITSPSTCFTLTHFQA